MKIKYTVIVFVISLIVLVLGSLMKIMSWPGANELLMLGTALQVITYLLFIIKL